MLVLDVSYNSIKKVVWKIQTLCYIINERIDRYDGGDNEDGSDDVVLPLQRAHTFTTKLRTRYMYTCICNIMYTVYID